MKAIKYFIILLFAFIAIFFVGSYYVSTKVQDSFDFIVAHDVKDKIISFNEIKYDRNLWDSTINVNGKILNTNNFQAQINLKHNLFSIINGVFAGFRIKFDFDKKIIDVPQQINASSRLYFGGDKDINIKIDNVSINTKQYKIKFNNAFIRFLSQNGSENNLKIRVQNFGFDNDKIETKFDDVKFDLAMGKNSYFEYLFTIKEFLYNDIPFMLPDELKFKIGKISFFSDGNRMDFFENLVNIKTFKKISTTNLRFDFASSNFYFENKIIPPFYLKDLILSFNLKNLDLVSFFNAIENDANPYENARFYLISKGLEVDLIKAGLKNQNNIDTYLNFKLKFPKFDLVDFDVENLNKYVSLNGVFGLQGSISEFLNPFDFGIDAKKIIDAADNFVKTNGAFINKGKYWIANFKYEPKEYDISFDNGLLLRSAIK